MQREFFGVAAQHGINRAQIRFTPISGDGVNVSIGFFVSLEPVDLSTEVMRVRLCSINAVVGLADHDCQHFALRS
jgi:hypothetical protein